LHDAGFLLNLFDEIKSPSDPGFNMELAFAPIEKRLEDTGPDIVLAADEYGAYLIEVWRRGYKMPSLMITAHPDLKSI